MNPSLHPTPSSSDVPHTKAQRDSGDFLSAHFDHVTRWEDAALERLTSSQREVTWGDCWVGLSPDDEVVFGRVATVQEFAERERACGASAGEIEDSTRALHEAYTRGYRLGEVFTAEHTDGNFESTHLWNVLHRITPSQLAIARVFGFDVHAMRRAGVLHRHPDGRRLVFATTTT